MAESKREPFDLSKATPRPWFQGEGEINKYGYDPQLYIYADNPTDPTETLLLVDLRVRGDCAGDDEQHPSRAVAHANAALIVKAVNERDILRDLLRRCREHVPALIAEIDEALK